jgi:glycosyltransferase involved in cell wall biosynthesis
MKISVVIPAHNEEDNIKEVIKKIEDFLDIEHELVVVNDHSTDSTCEIVRGLSIQYPDVRMVDNLSEPGFANAIKIGFANIKTGIAVPVMGDLCDDLNTINEMFSRINDGYDVVCGARYVKGGARLGGSRIKGFFSSFVGNSLHYFLGLPTHDIANAFKMYRKNVIDSINIESKGFEVSMELALKAYFSGFKITEVPTVWRERTKGKSSFKMLKLLPAYLKLYLWAFYKRIRG